jgi:hypothetical protein
MDRSRFGAPVSALSSPGAELEPSLPDDPGGVRPAAPREDRTTELAPPYEQKIGITVIGHAPPSEGRALCSSDDLNDLGRALGAWKRAATPPTSRY